MGVETVSVALTDAYGTSVPPARGTCFELRATLGGRTSRSRSLRTATRHLALERLPLPMARRLYCGPATLTLTLALALTLILFLTLTLTLTLTLLGVLRPLGLSCLTLTLTLALAQP